MIFKNCLRIEAQSALKWVNVVAAKGYLLFGLLVVCDTDAWLPHILARQLLIVPLHLNQVLLILEASDMI